MPTPLTRTLMLNGRRLAVSVDDGAEDLLYVLRDRLGQHGPRFGCGVSQCGACTVLVDGEIIRSCVTPLNTVAEGASVETLDALDADGTPNPLQRTFVEKQAAQCAYCVNGIVMGSLGWLRQRKAAGDTSVPSEEEIAAFLSGKSSASTFDYICRCGAHRRMIEAIRQAAPEVLA
ncbi:MAG: 2Fe-2S iron-sulfur cluster binding domain-containing protein [Streptosporangiales bacterium]|nr:2Fe-2S iron-sulfur cluster binding domain-containing protein [Streptosporangiales bacterium]